MSDLLNIIIPVYNEGENIKKTLFEIEGKVKTPHRIYIIYDFDNDDTLPAVMSLEGARDIHLIKNKYGQGALNAIKTGFEAVNEGVILVAMADLSDDFAKVDEMLKRVNEGYDIICASRYMKGGKQIGGPKVKTFLSRMAGLTMYNMAGMPTHDITNSFKMYTKKVLNDIAIESTGGFELGMEIVIKAFLKGYKITEVPCVSADRQAGKAKFRLCKWLPHYLYWYWFAIKNRIKAAI